jgi:hypothetical protein
MLVATLIATITFAAAITVPGGNNQDKGTSIFLPNNKFSVFIWSDAVAFFSSMTSLVVFIRNNEWILHQRRICEGIACKINNRFEIFVCFSSDNNGFSAFRHGPSSA